jgi:sortase A
VSERLRVRIILAALLSVVLVALTVATTSGYINQKLSQVLLSGPNTVRCDRAATITATVLATESGKPLANQIVRWSLAETRSSGDGLNATSTITNDRGKTNVRLIFGPAAGRRTVQASAGGSSPTIRVRCSGGLPKTSVRPVAPGGSDAGGELSYAALLPPPLADGTAERPATSLRVDRLGIDIPLLEGDGFRVPDGYASHYPDTAWPGERGNSFVYGHAREGQFLELWRARRGDRVEVDLADGSVASYEVTQIHPLVAYDDFEMLEPTDTDTLTLQTCLTYEESAPRFVVIAERISGA